jgi:hypothetical protein
MMTQDEARKLAKNLQIGNAIKTLINNGMNGIDACKEVLGHELINNTIGQLYDDLRAKAAEQGTN